MLRVLKQCVMHFPIAGDHSGVDIQTFSACLACLVGSYFKGWEPVVYLMCALAWPYAVTLPSEKWSPVLSPWDDKILSALLTVYEIM